MICLFIFLTVADLPINFATRTEKALGPPVCGKGLCLEETQLSSILISALTDNDMEIIDAYACHLETIIGGDADEAFAIALDSFIRGYYYCLFECINMCKILVHVCIAII
jgi:hypothetical protein